MFKRKLTKILYSSSLNILVNNFSNGVYFFSQTTVPAAFNLINYEIKFKYIFVKIT